MGAIHSFITWFNNQNNKYIKLRHAFYLNVKRKYLTLLRKIPTTFL